LILLAAEQNFDSMSEPLSPIQPGSTSPRVAGGYAASETNVARPALKVSVGQRLEVQLGRIVSNQIEIRLRPADGNAAWSSTERVQLAASLPESVARQLVNTGAGAGTSLGPMVRIQAEVTAISPTLVLRLLPAVQSAGDTKLPTAAGDIRDWMDQQLRLHLPLSRPITSTLETWAARPIGSDLTVSAQANGPVTAISGQLQTILEDLATADDLTDPQRLASTLKQSGLWLEALFAQTISNPENAPDLSRDLKAQLLRLAEQIRSTLANTSPIADLLPPEGKASAPSGPAGLVDTPTSPDRRQDVSHHTATQTTDTSAPSALARDVDGMLKQLISHQLQTLETSADQPRWILELPFRTPTGLSALNADIQRENRTGQPEDDIWSMRIDLDLPRLGPLSINLSLRAGRLSAGLRSESQAVADMLRVHLADLRRQLEGRSIEVASLHAGHRTNDGDPPPARSLRISEQA
jgi:hypothetical protein